MLKAKELKYNVGVIVGRFQVPELHPSHKELIEYVNSRVSKLIIFLGCPPTLGTPQNPLDFEMRKQMIVKHFPNAIIMIASDCVSDNIWSSKLDYAINSITTPIQKTVLYGSRDSFINRYSGKYPTIELDSDSICSGTEIRNKASVVSIDSPEFRAGVVWGITNQYSKVFPTVDIAILNHDNSQLLLGRKPNEILYRFIGGFADPKSKSYESDARREVMEEVGIEISEPAYIGSTIIDDWRYRKGDDKIKTLFFVSKYVFGSLKAGDDIASAEWFHLEKLKFENFVPEHRELFGMLVKYLSRNK